MRHIYFFTLLFTLSTALISCSDDNNDYVEIPDNQDPDPVSPVVVDLTQVPYQKLSDYKFFDGAMKNQQPALNVLPYRPASELFTDYAQKKRFIWMPTSGKATFNGNANVLELPVGAVLIKTFYYDNVQPINSTKILETRVMIRKSTGWIFAEYVWNEDQTEAFLDMAGSNIPITWKDDADVIKSTNYRIPSEQQCMTCHKVNEQPVPIGIKPQSLNNSFPYASGNRNQLAEWVSKGYLENNIPESIASTVDYKDQSQPLGLRVRSYLDMNCAHCHQTNSHCDYRPMRFAFNESENLANMGVCIPTQDMNGFPSALSNIVSPANTNRSMLHFRLNTEEESYRMPLLGRTIVHEEGVALIEQWINSLNPCN